MNKIQIGSSFFFAHLKEKVDRYYECKLEEDKNKTVSFKYQDKTLFTARVISLSDYLHVTIYAITITPSTILSICQDLQEVYGKSIEISLDSV